MVRTRKRSERDMKRLAITLVAVFIAALLVSIQQSVPQAYSEEWWNGSWHYRIKLTVNTSYFERVDWPVEYDVNFTALMEYLNLTGGLDENSTRVVEVNSSGGVLWEIPSQFDQAPDYNQTSNADGTVIFILNGTNPAHTERWFYVYFDTTERAKSTPSYPSIIESSWDGEELNVTFNNEATVHHGFFVFDTLRGSNTSGLYQYRLHDEWRFTYSGGGESTREYIQTTDGSESYSYDLRYNASISEGPARVRIHQEGYEMYWGQADNKTNLTYLRKTYYFYPNQTWFVIEHEIININDSAVTRGSYAGLSGFDMLGAYGAGYKWTTNYTSDPGSFVYGSASLGTERGGYAHLWENGTSNFMAGNSTTGGSPNYNRLGINLSMTTIQPGESIQDRSFMVFSHTVNSPTLLQDTMFRLMNDINVTAGQAEMWVVTIEPEPDHGIYNRNESAIIGANITRDDWFIVDHLNATLDMGTPGSSADDVTIELLDDGACPDTSAGDGFYTAYYNLTDSENLGYWNMTVRAYDADKGLLNESYYTFNLTAEFNVEIDIWNNTGIWRVENATVNVTNYRQDIYIPGVTLNCTTDLEQIPSGNITDHGDGTYTVVFETPVDFGLYPLNCSAEKDGSWGFKIENYTVEAPNTSITLSTQPASFDSYNVTFYGNESFNLRVTLQNIENSTAYDANISLTLPGNISSNSTFEECGEILIALSCVKDFNITTLNNSAPGDYQIGIDINWSNRVPPDSSNTTTVNITVHENPVLDVQQENITGILPPGASSQVIESLLIQSLGNNNTNNVTFTTTGLANFSIQYNPTSIPFMTPGEETPVQVITSVPAGQFPGVYDGLINVTSDNGGYEVINTTIIVTGTNLTINTTPDDYSANYVTALNNESFEFVVNVTNPGNTTAFNSYVNVTLPGKWYINQTIHSCGNLTSGSSCMAYFYVNITELTMAGDYEINTTIFWEDVGISWRSESELINVSVVSNVSLEVIESQFTKTIGHGTSAVIGNLTIRSTGNDNITNVDFNLSQELQSLYIEFNQSYPFDMLPGDSRTIRINSTLPLGFDPGDYEGTLNVTSDNDGYGIVLLNISVPQNGSWSINTTFCEHAQSPNTGKVCDVLITNYGNILLNFSIDPPTETNHSIPSAATLNISKQDSAVLTINYDMGGDAGTGFFFTNYTITPNQSAADPDNATLNILLNPYVEPFIEINVTPQLLQQGDSVLMYITVTSKSGAPLDDVILTVERPDGTNDTMPLLFSHLVWDIGCTNINIDQPDEKACYQVSYPGTLSGNTSGRGNYTIYVFANDTYDVNATNTSIFEVYTRYMIYLNMPDTVQGSWESIIYRAQDYLGVGLAGASVNLTVKDPDNRTVYMLSGSEYTTDSQGWVGDNIFIIPAHATEGEYTIYSNGSYYDTDVSLLVSNESSVTFNVSEDQELKAKVSIPSPSYVDNTMTVSLIVLDNYYEPIDPDTIDITIYYTEGYDLTVWRSLDMGDLNQTATGFYKYQEVLSSVLTGSYLALLTVTEGDRETYDIQAFRISSGGPYDVILDLGQSQVEAGNPLPFDITIWNKGEIDHLDVVATYWVSRSGQTWDSASFSTNILGGQNLTFARTAFIYSNQPPGIYTLNAEVLYDPNQPPATANVTFLVTSPGEEPPPDDGGGDGGEEGGEGGPSAGPSGTINITKAPSLLAVMVGEPKTFSVEVTAKNGPLSNIWLEFQGIPSEWVTSMYPMNISSMTSGEKESFTIELTVPRGESGDRLIKAVAHSTESTDDKDITLRIFTSREDLINFELTRLKAKLEELRDRSDRAREAGFDTSEVDDLLDDAGNEIKLAEGYLREELYDPALDSIYIAWELLDEAEDLLDDMAVGFAVPWWVLLIVVFAVVITAMLFLFRKMSKRMSILIRGRMSEARQVAKTVKGTGEETMKLREEKGKTERMLVLLQSQYKQGIISKEAYESLKKRSDQRIAELERKIREAIKG